jgi:protein-disulfide isomerase
LILRPPTWLLLALVLLAACGPEAPPRSNRQGGVEPLRPSGVTVVPETGANTPAAADPRSLGDPNAPITLIEYSDFQ